MGQQHEREWVRNHKIAGYVVGRFQGEHEGTWRDLVAVQTWDGAHVVPEAALIPIDKDYMIRQAGLDLERVIQGILEGGLELDDAQAAWDRAMSHIREVAERQRVDQT
jgi:hypothetical protein